MNKINKSVNDDMRQEYDFSSGVRGKHYKAYREGHTVTIHQEDGTTLIQEYKLEENAVVLEPDVYEYFSDSESVNHALRLLISLAPEKRKVSGRAKRVKAKESLISSQNRAVSS
jgi:hypothetical protein